MTSVRARGGVPLARAAPLAWLAFAACAQAPATSPASLAEARVLVKLARPSADGAAIAAEATRRAGVTVTYGAAVSTSWHALTLHCAGAAECSDAVERLRAAASTYETVDLERRKAAAS